MLRRRQLLPTLSSTKINNIVLAHHHVLFENVKYFHSKTNNKNNNGSSLTMQPMKQPQQQQQRKSSFMYDEKEDDANTNDSLVDTRQTISTHPLLQQQQQKHHQTLSSIEGNFNQAAKNNSDAFTSDDPANKYQHSASDDFFANVDRQRRLLKPTIQQLEFPSGMTERITAASSSRVGALYQLHYSDTNVREIIFLRGVGTFPVKLQGLSQEDYLDGKVYLEREAAGTVTTSSTINTGDTIQKFDREINSKNDGSESSNTNEDAKNNPSSSTSSSPTDVGFLFTLYVENIPTDGALNTIAARFAVRRSDILTIGGYGKDQCTTQIAFAKTNTLSKEQILSINHMRFPGFCIKTSILYKKSNQIDSHNKNNKKKEMFVMTRREFSINSSHGDSPNSKNKENNNNNNQDADEDNDEDGDDHPNTTAQPVDNIRLIRNEVTTLLRRVQVAGYEAALHAVLNEIKDKGAINYYAPIQQESLVFAFRRLQDAKFKSAVLQLLRHKNIHPTLRAFVNEPSQSAAAAARRAIGNEQARGLLRTYIETNSFFRTIEAAPGSLKNLIVRTSRRLAWNTMASKRIRREIVNHFTPGPVRVQLRVGDFIITNPEMRCRSNVRQMKEQQQLQKEQEERRLRNENKKGINQKEQDEEEEEFSLGDDASKLKNINSTIQDDFEKTILRQDVLFIEDEQHLQEILSSPEDFNDLDIVLPVPTHGALQELETHYEANKKHNEEFVSPVEFMRSCLEELRLLGLVETPSEHFSEEQWKTLLGSHKIRSNRITFRSLMMDTRAIFVSGENNNDNYNKMRNENHDDVDANSNSAKRGGSLTKLEVAIDPAPTVTTVYDCNRVLLNDRLLLQGDRRNRGGLIDSYLSPQQYNKIIKTDEEEKKKQPQKTHEEQQFEQQIEDDDQSISYYEPSTDEGGSSSSFKDANQTKKDTLVTNNNKTAKQILDGLQLDSLITSKLLSHSTTTLTFPLKRSDDMELRRKLRLPPPPVPTDKLQASWSISDQSGIFKSAVQEARLIDQQHQQQQDSDFSSSSPADFHSVSPISDTSRLSTVVTALVQLHIQPAMLPCLLRETLNLHGVVSEEDAKLQQKIHSTLRSLDTSSNNTWNTQFCPICFLTTHSQSSECPIHQRRMALRLAQRERKAMAKETRHLHNAQQTGNDNRSGGDGANRNRGFGSSSFNNRGKAADEWEQAAVESSNNRGKATDEWEQAATELFSPPSQKQKHTQDNMSAIVKISKDANSKGKWGVKVDKNLFIADGCVSLQPSLGPYEPLEAKKSSNNNNGAEGDDDSTLCWKIVRVGASPVATFEQLKLALSNSGNEVELGLKRTRK